MNSNTTQSEDNRNKTKSSQYLVESLHQFYVLDLLTVFPGTWQIGGLKILENLGCLCVF